MSQIARDLLDLLSMPRNDDGKLGGLVELLLREYAQNIIAPGVASLLGGA
ncbi:hypothetical protein SB394_02675 [Burkholderia sp. BCCIQ04A]|uniref:Bacteriophage protein n=1 Tax=Burkholderia anthinoferrum TaxID=3090833 RepID=A0ABU5WTR1_9BURK|nr:MULTISPECIES: hypothetical protein [Burkholderia]MEB2535870.1 hypothetical protein [Burkholderia anthinoferrum]MEB2561998.1 hypothetical protein [Burkholderia anthinoferrum]MEB2582299.1 hypothetical protein [Burkholderia anthinoferrum]MDF3115845.1 hypothetical protein [Burkholderia semiarida]MEB2632624.1 hypothetical protein [Burkholderia anthinoferrum]